MKDGQGESGTDPPREESKAKKYMRLAVCVVVMALIALTLLVAALRKCGMM
jgi:hypothetical protein